MPDGTTAAPAPMPGAQSSQQMDELTKRLLSRIAQPRSQVQPAPGASQPPKGMAPVSGVPKDKGEAQQMFVHNLFSTIFNGVQAEKAKQLRHATGVLQSLNNAWSKAQDLAQGDEKKAQEIFSQMPEVTHIFEDKKNVKQLGKLLQFDFMEPEKKKTVWHEALGKVVEASKQLPFIKQISELVKSNKIDPKMSQAPDYAKREQEASGMAKQFAGQARPDQAQQAEITKVLPSMIAASGANLREREKEVHQEHMQQMKNEFAEKIQGIKDPIDKAIARGIALSQDGNTTEAQKYFDMAHKGAEAKQTKGPVMSENALVYQSVNDPDPEKRKAAQAALDKLWGEREKQLLMRGTSFGMSRPAQYVNSETGETDILNGFQVQQRIKAGEKWQMIGNIPPDIELAMQQVVRSEAPAMASFESHLKAFDNSEDRALISRVLRTNPSARGMDESTLGNWIDQNLTDKLSPDGKALMQDIKVYAEVMGRLRKLTGQTSSEMNTELLLGLLPSEKTPNATYAKQQLERVKNYIDGMVQAPLLGGGKFTGTPKKAAPKADKKKSDPLGILD